MRRPAIQMAFLLLCCGLFLDGTDAQASPRGGSAKRGQASRLSGSRPTGKGSRADVARGRRGAVGKSTKGKSRGAAHKRDRRARRRPPAPPPMPTHIEVVAADQDSGIVQVQLTGPARPPHANLFVLTDSRGRRFLPALAECYALDGPPEEGAEADAPLPHWRCAMSIPAAYRRADLTGVSMEWGERVIQALPGQVKARWAAAGTISLPAPTESPLPDPSEHGGAAAPSAEAGGLPGDAAPPADKAPGRGSATERGPGEAEPEGPQHDSAEPEDVGHDQIRPDVE